MSSSSVRIVPWLPVFAACIAGGWMVGRYALADKTFSRQAGTAQHPRASSSASPVPLAPPPNSPAARWVDRVKKADPAGFPDLFEEVFTIFPENGEHHQTALYFLFGHWIARNPNAALSFVLQRNEPEDLQSTFLLIMVQTAPDWTAALLFSATDLLPAEFKNTALRKLADAHPDIYLKSDPHGKLASWSYAMEALAGLDPPAAAKIWLDAATVTVALEKNPNAPLPASQAHLAFKIAIAWQKLDPAESRRWAESLPKGECRQNALNGWLSALAHRDPRAALRELPGCKLVRGPGDFRIGSFGEDSYSSDARKEIASWLAVVDFEAALTASGELALYYPHEAENNEPHPAILRDLRELVVKFKANHLPPESAAFLDEFQKVSRLIAPFDTYGTLTQELMKEVGAAGGPLSRMSAEQCLAAARLRRALVTNDEYDPLLNSLLSRATEADPAVGIAMLRELPVASAEGYEISFIQKSLACDSTADLDRLLPRLKPEEWTDSGVIYSLEHHLPEYASIIAALPGDAGQNAQAICAGRWAELDPEAAAAWVATLPDNSRAKEELAKSWASFDETAASQWAASFPDGAARDGAATGMVWAIGRWDPETAWQWVNSISDDDQRRHSLTDLATVWEDPPPEFIAVCAAVGVRMLSPAEAAEVMDPFAPEYPAPVDPFATP